MDAMEFWKANGIEAVRDVCAKAGTTHGYYVHIAHGRRRPSIDLAYRLVEASKAYGKKNTMKIEKLVKPRIK